MDVYIYANNDGSISGFSAYQPDGYNFPLVHVEDKDVEDFRQNWMYYTYQNGQLIQPTTNDGLKANDVKINKRLDTMQTQQAFLSQQMLDVQNQLKEIKSKVGA